MHQHPNLTDIILLLSHSLQSKVLFQHRPSTLAAVQICGEANVSVIREAAQAGVPRCAFVSAHDYKFPGEQCSHDEISGHDQ